MKILIALVLLVSMSIGCGDSGDPPGGKMEPLTADELCNSIAARTGERVLVEGRFEKGFNSCTARACEDAGVACNWCYASYFLSCSDDEEPDEREGIGLSADDDLDLSWVGENPEGPEFLLGDIPLKTRLGCVGSEDYLWCQPTHPHDIAAVEGTVMEGGYLSVHEVLFWHD